MQCRLLCLCRGRVDHRLVFGERRFLGILREPEGVAVFLAPPPAPVGFLISLRLVRAGELLHNIEDIHLCRCLHGITSLLQAQMSIFISLYHSTPYRFT